MLGKFAPLHKGHQYLIEAALKEMSEVMVMIYDCPETIDIPLQVRANWIRRLYPRVKVVEAWDGPTETGHDPRIMKLNEDYILKTIKVPITHFFSSEWYGEHVSKALKSKNVVVDMERKKFPTSGTAVRKDPWRNKKFLDPIVFNDMVKRVVFLGAESTGKSTIAKKMAEIYGTEWMPEFGREYWDKNNVDGKLSPGQLVELAMGHLEREDKLLQEAKKYLFVDTNAITTEMFSRFYHGYALPKLEQMSKGAEKKYDVYFVCETDIPYEEDGTRSGEKHRKIFQQQIKDDLVRRGIEYVLLKGALKERANKVKKVLEKNYLISSGS